MFEDKFDKLKNVVKEILEKSTDEKECNLHVLKTDVKMIMSYIRFSVEKLTETTLVGLNKSNEDKYFYIERENHNLTDLRISFNNIFNDFMYNINDSEKRDVIEEMRAELDILLIKSLKKLCPISQVKNKNEEDEFSKRRVMKKYK